MKKRILSSMIIIAMLISVISVAASPDLVSAAEPMQTRDKQEVTNEISVEGTTSAGEMVSKAIQTKQTEQTKNGGNNIYTVEMKGKTAAVSFETTQACTLLVAIYDEAGMRMLASGKKEVAEEQNEAQIIMETEHMPAYFYVKAFLIDSKSLNPLCTAYESPNYTREMQEFFDMTTDDFEDEQVFNFDKDKANNFAVYDKDTKVIEPESGKNIVEQVKNQYIIKNASSAITSLKPGDIFSYEYEPGDTLIVKVKDIQIRGTTATITEADASLEDAFDYVKLDTESSLEDAEIDASDLEEGVTYKGFVDKNHGQTKVFEGDHEFSKSLSFGIKKNKLSGNLTCCANTC